MKTLAKTNINESNESIEHENLMIKLHNITQSEITEGQLFNKLVQLNKRGGVNLYIKGRHHSSITQLLITIGNDSYLIATLDGRQNDFDQFLKQQGIKAYKKRINIMNQFVEAYKLNEAVSNVFKDF